MNRERGIIASMYIYAAVGVAFLALGGALAIERSRLAASKAETIAVQAKFDAFVAEAKALGEAQNAKTALIDATNAKAKETADAANAKTKRDLAAVYAAYAKLRDNPSVNSSGGDVSSPATFTSSADTTCFDSAALVESIRSLETGIRGILQQGDQAIADLDTAKQWATK